MAEPDAPPPRAREIPGKYVVLAIFALGFAATGVMFLYWDLHTRPFRSLTEAIGREFRHSLPKVEGGRHKGSPPTLRISFRVPFVPLEAAEETQQVVNRAVELARAHADLSRFERVQINLFQMVPEQAAKRASFEFAAADLLVALPFAPRGDANP